MAHLLINMSQLKLNPTWILELSTPDLTRAQSPWLKPEDVEAAKLLGDRLTEDRVNSTQREIDVLRNNLEGK